MAASVPAAGLLIHSLSRAMRGSTTAEERISILAPVMRPLAPFWTLHFDSPVPADFSTVGDEALVRFADATLKFLLSQPFPPSAGAAPPSPQQWGSAPWRGWASGYWHEGYGASPPGGPSLPATETTPNSADWDEWRRGAEVPFPGEHAGQAAYGSQGSSSSASQAQGRWGPRTGASYGTQSKEQRRHHRTGQWTDICVTYSREGSCRYD